jgi:dynein heavy chain
LRRYNYTTPKSFLELIEFYKQLLAKNKGHIENQIELFSTGLHTLAETSSKVADLQKELEIIMKDVAEKTVATNKLIEVVNKESAIAAEEQKIASAEEDKVTVLVQKANAIKADAEEKFLAAKPKLEKAEAALERLNEKDITVFKGFKTPPAMCVLTGKVLLYIYKGEKVDLHGEKDNDSCWKKTLSALGNVKRFIVDLKRFSLDDAKYMDPSICVGMHKLFDSGRFELKAVKNSSEAAYNLADWAYNIIDFNEAFRIVQPLDELKITAEAEVEEKSKELEIVIERVRVINEQLAALQAKLDDVMEQKAIVEAEKEKYQNKLDRAGKLVNGLAGENKRWTIQVAQLKQEVLTVIGDCLLASEFVSYIAPFTAEFRLDLWQNMWIPNIKAKQIPITEGTDPMKILTTSSGIA